MDDLEFPTPDGPRDHPSPTSIARRGLLRCALGRIDAAVPDLQRAVDDAYEPYDAMVACEALGQLPDGAGDAPQRLVTRILVRAEVCNAPDLDALLKRIHPDGPDWTIPCSGYGHAERWAAWFAARAVAPREPVDR